MCIPCLGAAAVKLLKEHDEPWVRRYIKNTNTVYILLSLIWYMLVISAGLQMYQLSCYSTTEMAQLLRYRFSCSCFLVSSVFGSVMPTRSHCLVLISFPLHIWQKILMKRNSAILWAEPKMVNWPQLKNLVWWYVYHIAWFQHCKVNLLCFKANQNTHVNRTALISYSVLYIQLSALAFILSYFLFSYAGRKGWICHSCFSSSFLLLFLYQGKLTQLLKQRQIPLSMRIQNPWGTIGRGCLTQAMPVVWKSSQVVSWERYSYTRVVKWRWRSVMCSLM